MSTVQEFFNLIIKLRRMSKKLYRESFLNTKKPVQLPSNLLAFRRSSKQPRGDSLPLNSPRLVHHSDRYFNTIEAPSLVGEKSEPGEKEVLYKRLSNIRGDNKEIGSLSFSKMLSRMVVMDDGEVEKPHFSALEQRMRHTINVSPVPTKVYNLQYSKPISRAPSRSVDLGETVKPSRKLFKKLYLPSSEAAQVFLLETVNPADKYIYKDGKKVECKRIHNFYTSHMFRNGYDKCFRKTSDSFKF